MLHLNLILTTVTGYGNTQNTSQSKKGIFLPDVSTGCTSYGPFTFYKCFLCCQSHNSSQNLVPSLTINPKIKIAMPKIQIH